MYCFSDVDKNMSGPTWSIKKWVALSAGQMTIQWKSIYTKNQKLCYQQYTVLFNGYRAIHLLNDCSGYTELFLDKILTKLFKNSVQKQLNHSACVLRIVFKITSLSVTSKLVKIT